MLEVPPLAQASILLDIKAMSNMGELSPAPLVYKRDGQDGMVFCLDGLDEGDRERYRDNGWDIPEDDHCTLMMAAEY
jgi:hypothetical protein